MTSSTGALSQITAGDSAAWSIFLPDHPASVGWALSFGLTPVVVVAGAAPITFAGSTAADGTSYQVNVAPAITGAWKPGRYLLAAYVSKGDGAAALRITAARSFVQVLPNPAAVGTPSHAQAALSLIEAAIEGRIPRGLEETTIDGQHIARIPLEGLHRLREKYRAEVANEQAAALAAAGVQRRNQILVRFRG